MSDQLALFVVRPVTDAIAAFDLQRPLPPAARNTDPATSHAAAEEQTGSGRRDHHAALVLAAVRATPGLTYRELHHRLAGRIAEAVEVMRRLNDLHTDTLVTPTIPRRVCSISGRPAQTWHPTEGVQP